MISNAFIWEYFYPFNEIKISQGFDRFRETVVGNVFGYLSQAVYHTESLALKLS